MIENITYGKAKLSDSLRISVLFKTIYVQTYESKGVTFEFANFVTQRFSPENIEKIIQSEKTDLIVAYIEDNPIGAAQINYDTICKIRKTPVTELDKLYVLPNYHGKGVGAGLMTQVEEKLKAKGIKEVNLIVYIHNQKAVKFYQKTGFVTLGNFDYQMEENSYVNLVMNKVL
ncbi:MAG: GNAT family N-acetyltransferase [Saprospiraceae bacterium]|nr:GNAT family N-acetyltransferase [Saprospiraceae bacterium]MBK8633520.1 GNAT family N-acetyltransferase [Saprospiraceae bacterium]MBP7641761.1 GNAT family N-acetyltransferase [Saprospiraceae bacterium]